MKKILSQALFSFITGFAFILGLVAATFLYDSFQSETEDKVTSKVVAPEGFEFTNHSREIGAAKFTVAGTLKNTSSQNWDSVHVSVTVTAGQAQLNYCGKTIKGVLANSEVNFEVKCSDAAGSGLPENIGYQLKVEHGKQLQNT